MIRRSSISGQLHGRNQRQFENIFAANTLYSLSLHFVFTQFTLCLCGKGSLPWPNRMNFRKSSKSPLTPLPIFGQMYWFFLGTHQHWLATMHCRVLAPFYCLKYVINIKEILQYNFWIGNDTHLCWKCVRFGQGRLPLYSRYETTNQNIYTLELMLVHVVQFKNALSNKFKDKEDVSFL